MVDRIAFGAYRLRGVLRILLSLSFLTVFSDVQSAIIPSGNFSPVYDGADPWEMQELVIGTSGSGELTVDDGSSIRLTYSGRLFKVRLGMTPDSMATVNVTGQGSTLAANGAVAFGEYGDAIVNVVDGGLATNIRAYLGYEPNSSGTVNVSGTGSSWRNSELLIGEHGSGTVSILDGGYVSSSFGRLGNYRSSTGDVLVDGEGSTWEITGNLLVGREGAGNLEVRNKGIVSNKDGTISSGSSLTVDGLGSVWTNSGNLVVDESGEGTLNITDQGIVNVAGGTVVGPSREVPIREYFFGPIVGYETIPASAITFEQGTLNTAGIWALPESLLGTGVINTANYVGDHDITFDANDDSQNQLIFNELPGQNVTINFDASRANNIAPLGVGIKASASLAIADGRVITSGDGFLGYEPGSNGAATVVGEGSAWNISNELFVGRYGNGKLSVLDGGTVDVRSFNLGFGNGSEGIATVRGPNSSLASSYLFEVGERGEGVLRIEDGASLTTNHSAIGYYSKGTVYVSGKGSTWDVQSETFLIGRNLNSQGAVHIEDGGQLSSRYGHIGQFGNSTGTVTVSGTDSEWRISRTLTVGNQGVGTLEIRGGAYVLNRMGRVAYDSSASGVVVVSGAGSVWDSASLHLGGRGSGELLIEDAARVFSSSQSTIAGGAESSGIVKVTGIGSSWTAYRLTVGYFGHGQLLIENGGLVEAQSTFTIDLDGDGDSHIRMKSGGMLAILGSASESLDDFLNLIEGTDAIEYWNGAQWDHILNAAAGVDFTLEHISSGKLEGYTVLTVGTVVPEPTSLMLVGVGLVAMVAKRSR